MDKRDTRAGLSRLSRIREIGRLRFCEVEDCRGRLRIRGDGFGLVDMILSSSSLSSGKDAFRFTEGEGLWDAGGDGRGLCDVDDGVTGAGDDLGDDFGFTRRGKALRWMFC